MLPETTDVSSRFTKLAVAAGLATFVWLAYRLDRRYERWEARWLAEVSPLTGPRARAERIKVTYRDRRADASDLAWIVSMVAAGYAEARSAAEQGRTRDPG